MTKRRHTCYFKKETFAAIKKLAELQDRSVSYVVSCLVDQGIEAARQEWYTSKELKRVSKGEPTIKQMWKRSGAAEKFEKFGK